MKKADKKATKPKKAKEELTKDDLDKVVGGLVSIRAKSFDPQPEPPGKIQIIKSFTP